MIQINQSGSLTLPTQTFDGVWITNLTINAPSPTQKVTAVCQVVPMNSTTGVVALDKKKNIYIQDVLATAASSSAVANAMSNIFEYVSQQVISKSLF